MSRVQAPLFSEKQAGKCDVCGRECEVHECRNGHLLCDGCADELVFEKVIDYCLRSESDDPYEIFRGIISTDCVRMHDYKHHVIVGSALLTANRNAGYQCDLEPMLREMLKRGRRVPLGACELMGDQLLPGQIGAPEGLVPAGVDGISDGL